MLCPKCGTENTEQAEFCVHCCAKLSNNEVSNDLNSVHAATVESHLETQNELTEMHESTEGKNKASQPRPRITNIDFQSNKPDEKPIVSSGLNIGIIIATVIFPIVGIAMGFTYLRKEHPDARKAGKTWLILGVVVLLINILMISSD